MRTIPRNHAPARLVYVHVGPITGRGELLDIAAAVGVTVIDASTLGPQARYRVDVFGPDPERVLAVGYFDGPDSSDTDAVTTVLDRADQFVTRMGGRYGDVFVIDSAGRATSYDLAYLPEVAR